MGMIPSRSPNRVTIRNLTKTCKKNSINTVRYCRTIQGWMTQPSPHSQDSERTISCEAAPSHTVTYMFFATAFIWVFLGTDFFFRPRDLAPSPFSFWSPAHRHFVMGLTRSLTDAGRKRSAEGREERFKQGKLPLKEPLAVK